MMNVLAKVKKAVGALLGGITGVAVTEILAAVHVSVPIGVASAIAGVLALLGTYLAPPNAQAASADKP